MERVCRLGAAFLVMASVGWTAPRVWAQAAESGVAWAGDARAVAPQAPSTEADAKPATGNPGRDPNGILNMDLDQLGKVDVVAPALQMHVSTVERTESTVGRTPAAVFVVTNEMIRRSTARTIPDVLRLVPGVEVAQIDANKWAVSIRGFNGRFANKLLVQIDGRTCYTPLYAGVFWDVQDLVLEDVERIEVIRGPGATIWGANAVNGVINIITKKARDTQGGLIQAGAGSEELGTTIARHGGKLGDDAYYRVYGKWFDRDNGFSPIAQPNDGWQQARAGFRCDWTPSECDTITFQGDCYKGTSGEGGTMPGSFPPSFTQSLLDDSRVAGGNGIVRWSREIDEKTDLQLQFFFDRTERARTGVAFREDRNTADLDFQYRFPLGDRHEIIAGAGYRNTSDSIRNTPFYLEFFPDQRSDNLYSCFVQDEITLREDLLYFIVGSKFEHNDYTGFEYQPSGRLLLTPSKQASLWAAISRAVRTPSRAEADALVTLNPAMVLPPNPPALPVEVPVFPELIGSRAFQAEDEMAYEAGIRMQPSDAFSWDLAVFYNKYQNLISLEPGALVPGFTPGGWPALFQPLVSANHMSGDSYGFELAANYRLSEMWRTQMAYSALWLFLHPEAGTQPLSQDGESPRNECSMTLSGNLPHNWDIDFIWRYVDSLPALGVPHYLVMDVRLAWRPSKNVELFVTGRNLLDAAHPEFIAADLSGGMWTEVQREVYGGVTWRF